MREYLQPDLEDGLLSTEELNVFGSPARDHGSASRRRAVGRRGLPGLCRLGDRVRVPSRGRARGVDGALAAEDEREYVDRLRHYRDQLRWHWETAAPLQMTPAPPAIAPASIAGSPSNPPEPAAACYADPWGQRRVRYWDGREWTGYTAD